MKTRVTALIFVWGVVRLSIPSVASDDLASPATMEARLAREAPSALAREAREVGDAFRGAVLFFRPGLQCARCHSEARGAAPLGPDLARLGRTPIDVELVESILEPSKVVRQGYETIAIATSDGKSYTGLLVRDRPDVVEIRDLMHEGKLVSIARSSIEARRDGGPSLMPSGLVNQLGTRGEFLDLLRYVIAIVEEGPARARALQPPESAFSQPALPEYERMIDHAGMISSLGAESLKRGQAIYESLCVNCHGTAEAPGSLPTSLRFSSGVFRNGSDPYRMYQTLTHGFGAMAPQSWMVPEQKYDVIHFIRETYLKPHNRSQYTRVSPGYLAGLPAGHTRGPKPSQIAPWVTMDYGPSLSATYEVGEGTANFAYKGIAVRLDAGPGGISRGRRFMVFDHDTMRVAGFWSGEGFIDWNGINFNGRHEVHPHVAGRVQVELPVGPGWADPETGTFDDPRPVGRDARAYGPLPRAWARFLGLYHHGPQVAIAYRVGETRVVESADYETKPISTVGPVPDMLSGTHQTKPIRSVGSSPTTSTRIDETKPTPQRDADLDGVFTRTVEVGPSRNRLRLRVARVADHSVAVVGDAASALVEESGLHVLELPASDATRTLKLLIAQRDGVALQAVARDSAPPRSLAPMAKGGPSRWPERLPARAQPGGNHLPFAVDVLEHPVQNPWGCRMRFSGLDFFPDGKALAVCSWDGDVWRVEGIQDPAGRLTWQRIASGLFQPLGLRIRDGRIFVSCRDQIVVLNDSNGDGETDFYESFNSDHQVTEHFHEFAMDLQTDPQGNFYYAKAARHGKTAVVPQHGTLLKVARDGSSTEILATGFRAPNGVCVNRDGSFFSTDQEGFWLPKNRINRVVRGGFYGNMWGYTNVTDTSDTAMEPPVCWITNEMDRSPAQPVWVTSGAWGPLKGALLNLSYGMGKVFVVPHETIDGVTQGGVVELPGASFPTGVMRGRFHPRDGQLYVCGMFAWAGNREQPGGLYRLRYTGKPVHVPLTLQASRRGISIGFSGRLDRSAVADPRNYRLKTWSLKRTESYGSKHYDERSLEISRATLADDGRTLFLEIPAIAPTWCMEIRYTIRGDGGEPIDGRIHSTIHRLAD
jgi:putative heme-binding domain-containing protein